MAGRARLGGFRMVKNNGRKAGKVGVTVTIRAIQAGWNVGRINLGYLADRHNTIVARSTVSNDTSSNMIKDATGKGAPRGVASNTIA